MLVVLAHEAVGEVCVSAITYELSQLPAGRGSTTCVGEIMVGVTTIFAILHTSLYKLLPKPVPDTVKVWSAILGCAVKDMTDGAGTIVMFNALVAVQPLAPVAVTEGISLLPKLPVKQVPLAMTPPLFCH